MELIIYALTTGFLLAYIAYTNKQNKAEREKLIKMIMSKNLQELTTNEIINKRDDKKVDDSYDIQKEFTEVADLDNKEFKNLIDKENG